MKKEKWSVGQIHLLRDRELRGSAHRLYLAIQKRIKNPNVRALDVSTLERRVVVEAKDVLKRYTEMVSGKPLVNAVPNEHVNIRALIAHLFEEAHRHVTRDLEQQQILEDVVMVNHRKLLLEHPL